MQDKITVILVTSVLPSHPDLKVVEETIGTIRHHLPKSEIILQIDGLRKEQERIDKLFEEAKKVIL